MTDLKEILSLIPVWIWPYLLMGLLFLLLYMIFKYGADMLGGVYKVDERGFFQTMQNVLWSTGGGIIAYLIYDLASNLGNDGFSNLIFFLRQLVIGVVALGITAKFSMIIARELKSANKKIRWRR